MDTYPRLRKCLVVGIILLFIGMSIIPSTLSISATTTLASTPFCKNKQQTTHQIFDTTPVPLPPPKKWMRTFGGMLDDGGFSVEKTTDGGYIVTGYNNWSSVTLTSNAWLIKIDDNGDLVWERTFKEKGVGYDVQQTNDGGYIITGGTGSSASDGSDVWLIKTDGNGSMVWNSTFTRIDIDYYGYSVQQITDGRYIIIGDAYSSDNNYNNWDFLLLKTDNNGHQLWTKTFGGTGYEDCYSGQQTTDGGYILAGYTYATESGYSDVWLIKTDENGDMVWDKTFGGTDNDWGNAVQQTTDGGYIITGETCWEDPSILLIKTDSNGNTLWNKILEENKHDYANDIQQSTDGGYIIIGNRWSGDCYDILLMKTDSNGNKIWERTFGKNECDEGESVQQTTDGGYILLGKTYATGPPFGDIWLIKTDENGDVTNSPDKPTITGKTKGAINTSYDYTIHTIDPDQDDVKYYIEWGDNTTTMTGLNGSGDEVIVSHTWDTEGTYNVKVKAIDEYYAESDWATLTVTMPCSYKPIPPFLEVLFQRFPNAFPLLRQLMRN
jgi:hypothetical protein